MMYLFRFLKNYLMSGIFYAVKAMIDNDVTIFAQILCASLINMPSCFFYAWIVLMLHVREVRNINRTHIFGECETSTLLLF